MPRIPAARMERILEHRRNRMKQASDGQTQYATGAVRSDDREEVRYDLISPIGLRRVAEACHEGAQKYGDFNWEKGMPVADLLNHAIAHVYAFLAGDQAEDHLGHAAWNLLAACHSQEQWPWLNGQLRGEGCNPPKNEEPDSIEVETFGQFAETERVSGNGPDSAKMLASLERNKQGVELNAIYENEGALT